MVQPFFPTRPETVNQRMFDHKVPENQLGAILLIR